jgi:hypothetical protein
VNTDSTRYRNEFAGSKSNKAAAATAAEREQQKHTI